MEKELLSIVATLLEFRPMLLDADITIYTDHKKLTFEKLQTQRVIRWRLFVEEYSPKLVYIEGERTCIADTLSRLDRQDDSQPALWGKIMPPLRTLHIFQITETIKTSQTEVLVIAPIQSWMKFLKNFMRVMILFTLTMDFTPRKKNQNQLIVLRM